MILLLQLFQSQPVRIVGWERAFDNNFRFITRKKAVIMPDHFIKRRLRIIKLDGKLIVDLRPL